MKLSIIIPVYNVEQYVRDTLDSIYNQRYNENEFEVIVVNDGTPDRSMEIVSDFVKEHNNIHIINQTNQGLSCARNSGLNIAKGEYIWFVDSDDKLSSNSIKLVITNSQETPADILGYDLMLVNEKTHKKEIQNIVLKKKYIYDKYKNCFDVANYVHNAPIQRFLYKREFLKKNQLFFYPNIIHEDIEFNVRAFFRAQSILMKKESPYEYLIRSTGSIMSSLDMRSVKSKIIIINSFIQFKNNNAKDKKSKLFFNNAILFVVTSILKSKQNSPDYKQFIKKYTYLFRKLAWRSFCSNIFAFQIKKSLISICILIHPKLFRSFYL